MHFPCVAPHWVPFQGCLKDTSEVGAIDCLQLVTVRVAHAAHTDYTGQSGGKGVAAEGGGWCHGTYNLDALHSNKLQVGIIKATVSDQLRTYMCAQGVRGRIIAMTEAGKTQVLPSGMGWESDSNNLRYSRHGQSYKKQSKYVKLTNHSVSLSLSATYSVLLHTTTEI